MSTTAAPSSIVNQGILSRLLRAGLLTGVIDGLFSSVLSVAFYHSTVSRLFQGVASTVAGKEALDGGIPTVLLGVLMHFGVAFAQTHESFQLTGRNGNSARACS